MHPGDKEELRMAMDEASGPILLRNWVEVRTLFLLHLKQKFSLLGAPTVALFSRDEYQKDKGNLLHKHLVVSIDIGQSLAYFLIKQQLRLKVPILSKLRQCNKSISILVISITTL